MSTVTEIHAEYDDLQAKAFSRPEARAITCRKGCWQCCFEPVYVNKAEVELMVSKIPPEEMSGVLRRTFQWLKKVLAGRLLDEQEPHVLNWLRARALCPLNKDGLCLVYENRPLACRAHCAIGDPKSCGSPDSRLKQKYAYIPNLTGWAALKLAEICPEHDHLGCFLVRKLLNQPVPSAAHVSVEIEFAK